MDMIRRCNPDYWLDQVFSAKAVSTHGVIRRSRDWVATEIGVDRFENAVRARGFHLIEAGQQLVVICHAGPVIIRF